MPYFGRHQVERPHRRFVSAIAVVAVVSATTTGAAFVGKTSVARAAGTGTVGGVAYVDYNFNGALDRAGGANTVYDVGVAGVQVSVTDTAGSVVGTATTAADGSYTASVTGAASSAVRVRFTPPAGYVTGAHGTQSGSTVQFATLGSSAASTVDLTLARPGDYSQSGAPTILQVQQWAAVGATQSQGVIDQKTRPSLTSSPYTTSGTQAATAADITTRARMDQTGSVWGVAQVDKHFAFTAAHFRRHAFVGPGGMGALYLTDLTSASPNASVFAQIPDAGANPRTNQDQMTWSDWAHDTAAYPLVGKIGLGGVAIAPDYSALYVVNLNNKKLYRVPVTYAADGTPSAGTPTAVALPNDLPGAATGCAADKTRPFGVSAQNGALWVTETCVGPTTNDLRGYVYRYDLGTGQFGGSPAFETTLSGYNRGQTYGGATTATWTVWPEPDTTFHTNVTGTNSTKYATSPEPLLADVVFDSNGDMTIGVKDRYADQYGYHLYGPDSSSTNTYEAFAGGDELRACGTEATGWTLESNGVCGSRTGYTTTSGSLNGKGDNQGPGGGEFYSDNYATSHQQAMLGAILQVPGYPEVVGTSYDPGSDYRTNGQRFQNNSNGQSTRSHVLQDRVNDSDPANLVGSFSKAGGLGDLTALVQDAPVEIGNRLWFDTDHNGVQDAGEAPVVGATVHLYSADGATLLDTAVTASDGTYYFSSAAGTSTASERYGVVGLNPQQDYVVKVDKAADYASGGPLAGYLATLATVGSDREIDSDGVTAADGTTTRAGVTTGAPGSADHTVDFGFVKPVSVGDFVWDDVDRDGVQDPDEPGLAGVQVTITNADGSAAQHTDGSPVAPVTTGSDGAYEFTGLAPGVAYTVGVATPNGYVPTTPGAGTDPALDSSTGSSTTAVLAPGDSDGTADFGFVRPAVSVGDRVFLDSNHDGIQNTGDAAIVGVQVTLTGPTGDPVTDVNGSTVGTATTDDHGYYRFDRLPVLQAGQHYTVHVDSAQAALAGAGYAPTTAQASGSTTADDSSTGTAESIDLTGNGDSDPTLDFGFVVPDAQVGDYVWEDLNGDGVQQAGEPGIADVQLTLTGPNGDAVTDTDGNAVGPATTSSTGRYRFANLPTLPAGQHYTVHIAGSQSTLAGYEPTKAGQGTNRARDSSTGSAESRNLTQDGDADSTLDFGFVRPVTVGDSVWNDVDRDGVHDADEPGIAGVTLTIGHADGSPVLRADGSTVSGADLSTTSGSDGAYAFTGLAPGTDYTVTVTSPPAGFVPAPSGKGTPATDSSSGSAASTVLNSGGEDDTLDFGFVRDAVSVGDRVFVDSDRDGVQGAGEPGIDGVHLTITAPDGATVTDVFGRPVGDAVTDAAGNYSFDGLPALAAGQGYTVHVDNSQAALADFTPARTGQGTPATDSSDGTATSGDLTGDGDSDDTLDFGFTRLRVSVGDFVWEDLNGDGVQDAGEPGIAGVHLTLTGPDGTPVTDASGTRVDEQVTDADGAYSFGNLPVLAAGRHYTVHVDNTQDALAAYSPTRAGQGTAATDSSTSTATSGDLTHDNDRDPTLDFGFVRPVTVGDFVWRDTDRDGVQDAGEPGVRGVGVTISHADGSPVLAADGSELVGAALTHRTDAAGAYRFTGLYPGSYTVTVSSGPAGLVPTKAGQGSSTTDSSTGSATSSAVASNLADTSLDFGFVVPAVSVGDFVWRDTDRDGVQDAGEPGIADVHLTLTGPSGAAVTDVYGNAVGEQVTDADGAYAFTGLPALAAGQSYAVHVDNGQAALADFLPTRTGAGTSATDSSTATAASGDLVTDGASDPSLDFGFVVAAVSVGDFVWNDLDGDGVQGAGEPGIRGVVLTVTGPNGAAVTDVFGHAVGSATTDVAGAYAFTGLPALPAGKHYTVHLDPVQPALASYVPTRTGAGTPATDSAKGAAASGDLTSNGDRDTTLDFGFYQPVSVGDFVWRDADGDGVQKAGEPGIEGVTVTLTTVDGSPVTDADGMPVTPMVTDASGHYLFDGLPPGAYTVTVSTPDGYVATRSGVGTTATDSSTGAASSGVLASGGTDDTLDFGFVADAVSVGDFVWDDLDGNGRQDAHEPGIEGVVLRLTGPDGQPVTDVFGAAVGPATTDAAGHYSFDLLPVLTAGEHYTVTVDAGASAAALAPFDATSAGVGTPDHDSSTGHASSGDLTSAGDRDATLDFGYVAPPAVAPTSPAAPTPPTSPGTSGGVQGATGSRSTSPAGGASITIGDGTPGRTTAAGVGTTPAATITSAAASATSATTGTSDTGVPQLVWQIVAGGLLLGLGLLLLLATRRRRPSGSHRR